MREELRLRPGASSCPQLPWRGSQPHPGPRGGLHSFTEEIQQLRSVENLPAVAGTNLVTPGASLQAEEFVHLTLIGLEALEFSRVLWSPC